MNDIVKIRDSKPTVSTFDLFAKMGYKEHRMLKKVLTDNIESFNRYGLMQLEVTKPKSSSGGRPVKSYLLNEDHFVLLVILAKNSKESVDLKVRVADEFKRMKQTLANIAAQQKEPDWVNVRKDGKAVYHQKSSIVEQFVAYAEKSGSQSASRYYGNLAKMENSALFFIEGKYKNLREIMTIKQLMQVATADQVIEKALLEGMEKELYYKDIYVLAKERVIAFAQIIGKSHLHDLALESK